MRYVVYDRSGKSIVIEPVGGRLLVHDNPLGVMSNSPTFDWHMTNLRNYIALDPRNIPPIEVAGETFKQLGQGSGMLGLPGDFSPPSRFVRAAVFSATAIPSKDAEAGIAQVFHILNNFDIPVGVAREEADGVIHTDYTMLTMARDPQALAHYYKSYDDQTLRVVRMKDFDLDGEGVKLLNTRGEQPIVEMGDKLTSTGGAPAAKMAGSDRDADGCISSAGYAWCARTNRCERPWELAEAREFAKTREAFDSYCGDPAQ